MRKFKITLTETPSNEVYSQVEFPIEINGHSTQEMIAVALKRCFCELEQKLVKEREADKYQI